jgi:pimeloyl-ACP methyl ester carboxylesterase
MMKKILLTLFAVIALLLLYVAYGRKNLILSKEEVRTRYTTADSKFLNWKGNVIHYIDHGTGPTVLMIHGFGGSHLDFRFLDSLMYHNYRIIRVDLPGFGLSDFPEVKGDNPDYNEMYTEFFNFFIDTLHIDSMYVAGNSMGGMAAWDLAVTHPEKVKKLVLLSSAGYDMQSVVKVAAKAFRFNSIRTFAERGIPKFITRMSVNRCFSDRSRITDERIGMLNDMWNREGHVDVFFNLATNKKWLDTALIKTIKCPTLIIWGEQDQIIPVNHAYRFNRDIKGSKVIIYSPCGHVPMAERPGAVKNDLDAFFKSN